MSFKYKLLYRIDRLKLKNFFANVVDRVKSYSEMRLLHIEQPFILTSIFYEFIIQKRILQKGRKLTFWAAGSRFNLYNCVNNLCFRRKPSTPLMLYSTWPASMEAVLSA